MVEDHPATASAVKQYLEVCGYQVDVAVDVKSAIQFASTDAFDVLVSDLKLPDGTGWDLMEELCRHRHVRGIAFSASNAPEDRQRSKEAGFAEHIVKTADPDMLVEAIERAA